MIRSATELLMNDVSTSKIVDSNPHSRLSQNVVYSKKLGALLATRFNCMQAWFIRCSWLEKFQFLTRMLYSISSLSSLSIILNTLLSCSGKSSIYSIGNNSNFVYDKGLNDYNRALHPVTLKNVQENDLQWFKSLTDDSDQVLVFIGLLRLGGGLIIYETYKKGVKLFDQLTSELSVKSKTSTSSPRASSQTQKTPYVQNRLNIVPDLIHIVDPADPIILKTATCKKEFEDAVKKYRRQVENRTNAGQKLEKKKKPIKENKKEKALKSEDSSDLDFLQLIPITIVKMIFNYLDLYTLIKIKNVNKYWEYGVKDLIKEKKGRKNLDKFIKKLTKGASDENIIDLDERQSKLVTVYDKSYPKKRIKKLWNRGSVLPKLLQHFEEPFVRDSWITKSDDLSEYFLQVQNLKLFPRSFSCNPLLHKHVSGTTLKRRYTVFDDLVLDDFEEEKIAESANSNYNEKTSNSTNVF